MKLKTRRRRKMAELTKKLAVWIFLLIFVVSVVGVILVTVETAR